MLACVAMPPRSWSVLALLLTGCQEPTAIRVEVSVQADCAGPDATRSVLRSTGFVIGEADVLASRPAPFPVTEACTQGDPMSRVGDLVVTPTDASDGRIGLRVFAGLDDTTAEACAAQCGPGCIEVSRRLSFVDNTTLFLPIEARRSCIGVCCDDGETCQDGECVSDTIDEPCVDGGDCDPRLPLALDAVTTANPNSLRAVRVLGGVPPFEVTIVSGEGQLDGSGRTYTLTTGPNHGPVRMRVVDGAGAEVTTELKVGGSQLFVLGGYETVVSVDKVFTTTDGSTWSQPGSLPLALSGTRAAVWRDELWFVGGTEQDGTTASSVVYSSRDGVMWTPRAPLPEPRQAGHLWVTDLGLIYAGGTFPGIGVPRAHIYRLASPDGTWTEMPSSLPEPRSHGGWAAWRGRLYVVKGRNSGTTILSSAKGDAWETLALPPPGGTYPWSTRAVTFRDALWVVGGREGNQQIILPVDSVHRLDDPNGAWSLAADLPEARFAGALAVHADQLWYIGGSQTSSGVGRNTVYRSADGLNWLSAPALPTATTYTEAISFTPNAP